MSQQQKVISTIGIMLGLFMASMEATVVSTAMPTIVSQLGGLERYSWVFSAYMLASTTTVPLYGKLSDLYGRRRLYWVAMALFLLGSFLCGSARSMTELIIYRVLQGLGAGGVMPMVFIMIGEMFTLQQRARMQGVFAGVWGVSSVAGPLLGGLLVDQLSWRWVFWINVVPGVLATLLVWWAWRDQPRSNAKPVIDFAGAGLLTAGAVALLTGLMSPTTPLGWFLILLALAILALLVWVERRAVDPILPASLFGGRLFSGAVLHGLLTGWAMFGSLSFVPLFAQAVLGASPTEAGATLTPMLLGWVFASMVGSRLLLKFNYRTVSIAGTSVLALGALLLAFFGEHASRSFLLLYLCMMGVGMGLSIPAFLLAVQTMVDRRLLGTATSTLQFSRTIGGALGVSVMGATLSARLASNLSGTGFDLSAVDKLLSPEPGTQAVVDDVLRAAVANGIAGVFLIAFVGAALAVLAVILLTPAGKLAQVGAVPGNLAQGRVQAAEGAPVE